VFTVQTEPRRHQNEDETMYDLTQFQVEFSTPAKDLPTAAAREYGDAIAESDKRRRLAAARPASLRARLSQRVADAFAAAAWRKATAS
jgi:hypothetical protein